MIAWRANACAAVAVLAIALTTAATAQIGAPRRLIPQDDASGTGGTIPVPGLPGVSVPPLGTPRLRDDAVRDEGALKPLNTGAIGLLDERNGGLPASLWAGSTRRVIDPLLAAVTPARLPALRDLTRRALASSGAPPTDEATPAALDFVALRARGLFRLGDREAAGNLADRVSRNHADETARAVSRDVLFLAPDPAPSCDLVREAIALYTQPDWQAALIACQTLQGDATRAQLGLTMLREQNAEEDDWLDRLVAFASGAKRALEGSRRELKPHHLALFAAGKTPPPAAALDASGPAVLAAIALNESFPSDARLRAAEAAVAAHALPGETLAALYDSVTLSARETADAMALAERERGPRARAALFKVVKSQTPGLPRAEALGKAMQIAERRGVAIAFRRAVLDLALEIPPASESAPHAGVIARLLLGEGRTQEASRWFDLLRLGSGIGEDGPSLAPLLYLGGAADRNLISPEALRSWRDAQGTAGSPRVLSRTRLLAELLDALGAASNELTTSGTGSPVAAPAQLIRLSRAASQRHVGETLLLASAALNEASLRDNPTAIGAVVRALREVGLADDARAVALDAALAAGL